MSKLNFQEIIKRQRAFFAQGKPHDVDFRLAQLAKLQKLIRNHETDLCLALQKDLGKAPLETYMTEIGLLYHSIGLMTKHLRKWQRPQRKGTPLFLWPAKSRTIAKPYGVTVIMSAYNYPLLLSLDPLIGSLAGGNTAIVALSEATPHVNQVLIGAIEQSFTADYLFVYQGDQRQNTALLKEPVDYLFFTGSSRVGKIVLQAASHHLTPVTLELGGKSPALVTSKAYLKTAAERIVWGKFLNAGQTCVAPDYCLVDAKVAEGFIEEVKQSITRLYGTDIQQSPDYGRLVNRQHSQRLAKIIEQDQAFLIHGGTSQAEDRYLEPTLLRGDIAASQEMTAMKEELFGPILPIITYEKLSEAETLIKQRPAPLAFYPFSADKREIKHLLSQIQAGGATVNDTVLHLSNSSLPFGGVGQSGMGSYHGKASFKTFTHEQAILVRHAKVTLNLMFPPYTAVKERLIRCFLK